MTLANEIVASLRDCPDETAWCVDMPANKREVPHKLWVEPLGLWLVADGLAASLDQGRGTVLFNVWEQADIRRAIEAWEHIAENANCLNVVQERKYDD